METESASGSREYDLKLERVACALDSITRIGDTIATGACEHYPLPGVAIRSNGEDELLFPLRPKAVDIIKAHGTISQQDQLSMGVATAWEVKAESLELRNPQWHEFLGERLSSMRGQMGIASTAALHITLNKVVLVESGARLPGESQCDGRSGVFGTLVVVMPEPLFEGGGFVSTKRRQQHQAPHRQSTEDSAGRITLWRPSAQESGFRGITFAAFSSACAFATEPLTAGAALCLLYDIVTTRPSGLPLYGGLPVAQQCVNGALNEYFDVAPASLAKRFNLAPDAVRIINEFAAERHFVYIVEGYSFEKLNGDERKVAQSLAAFCAQSGGQFALFFASVLCSQERTRASTEWNMTLKSPWLKFGEFPSACKYPPVDVRIKHDVAPLGRVEQQELHANVYDLDDADLKIVERKHKNHWQTAVGHFRALVVQPAMIEQLQLAKLGISDCIVELQNRFGVSREEALRCTRRIVHCHREWIVGHKDMKPLESFVTLVMELNDRPLLLDLLRSICLKDQDHLGILRVVVDHVGWDACVEVLVKRLLSTPTLRSRVHLINAVVDASSSATRINQLLTPLLSLHPWTVIQVDHRSYTRREYEPSQEDFARLLNVARGSSYEMLMQVVSMSHAETFIRVAVPALACLTKDDEFQSLQPVVVHVSELFQEMAAVVRNRPFADVQIPTGHCDTCDQLHSFLRSTATQMVMQDANTSEQCDHIAAMLRNQVVHPGVVKIQMVVGATTLRLEKKLKFQLDGVFYPTTRAEEMLHAMESQASPHGGSW
jgi:hypothetical protein